MPEAPTITAWQLRWLICSSGQTGPGFLDDRTITSWDPFHGCQAYVCADYAEFQRRNKEAVGRKNKSFYGVAELYNPDTRERQKLENLPADAEVTVVVVPKAVQKSHQMDEGAGRSGTTAQAGVGPAPESTPSEEGAQATAEEQPSPEDTGTPAETDQVETTSTSQSEPPAPIEDKGAPQSAKPKRGRPAKK